MILCGATTNPDATSCSSPYPSSTSSTAAKSNTINSTQNYTAKQPRRRFLLSRRHPDLLAFLVAALFVLLNFANWPCAQCVDTVVTRQSTLAQKLWPQLVWNRSHVAVDDGKFTRDEVFSAEHKRDDLKIIDSTINIKRHSKLAINSLQKPTCFSSTPKQSQQVKRGWQVLPTKSTIRKRFATESVMKREVYPLPGEPPIKEATSYLHGESFLGPRSGGASSDGRTHNDTTIIHEAISHPASKQETRILSTPIIKHPQPSIDSPPTQPTSSAFTVDRFKTSIAFEAAAKQRYHDQGNQPHYGGRTNESDTYPGHILRRRPNIGTMVPAITTDNETAKWKGGDSNGTDDDIVVTLLGLFELSTKNNSVRSEGHSELAAARLAVRHINKLHLLPGYRLELVTNDTKCDPGVGVDRFFHALYTQTAKRMIMLLGTACSDVTESLAKVVPYWNIVQVSFGSTSPALSDRREFPFFFRTVAPDSSHNLARIAFIRRFRWDTVTTFSQNEEIHSLAVNDLVTQLERANITCAATFTFAETDFKEQLRMLRDLDTRIIVGSFSHDLAPRIFCEAYKLGMYGADYAWILHETFGTPWWRLRTAECSSAQVAEAAENVLFVSSYNRIVGEVRSISGLTNRMFLADMSKAGRMSRYAPQTYDAVWAIALALRSAELHWRQIEEEPNTLGRFDYSKNEMTLEFMRQMERLNFLGVSGPVSFRDADRVGTSIFLQIQRGHLLPVALYHPSTSRLDFENPVCRRLKWHSGQVPIAKRVFRLKVTTIAPTAFYTVTTFASIGITVSVACLAFNLHFRKLKSIKLSSPKLSNIIAVGCILVYAAVILLGLDYSTLPASDKAFSIICTARVYLLSSGFSLAFGSMFAKTYRVHRIFTLTGGGGVCKDKMLRDTQLISLVCALLLLDGLVVTLWVVVDPMERHLSNLTLEISLTDRSVVYQPQVEVCRSHHTQSWLGALYAYKGLLLIVGVYMAWETRHVKIAALNDSQYIGVSVYSVVITSAIVVVLANLIADQVTLAFVTITALILTSTTATLSLLFVPKINDIWAREGAPNNDPISHSMGLKMEYNTRRFMTDDRRELQYRVEVQNRVYKKEMAALDAEIAKLQRMLTDSRSSTSSSSVAQSMHRQEIALISDMTDGKPTSPHRKETSTEFRTMSIGGGLPMLLLSVLPPVIPRASWPSSDVYSTLGRKSVAFSSQPQLQDEDRPNAITRLPAIDLLNLRLTHQQATAEGRTGWLNRIRGIFSTRKDSSASVTENATSSTFHIKRQLGKLTTRFSHHQTARSCNALHLGTVRQPPQHFSKSGSALHRIGVIDVDDLPAFTITGNVEHSPRKPSIADPSARTLFASNETRVLFQLPDKRRISSAIVEASLRDRIRGSPRFPHRIAPTSSLGALGKNQGDDLDNQVLRLKSKWKSMDETSFTSVSATSSSSSSSSLPSPTEELTQKPNSNSASIGSYDLTIDEQEECDASISIVSVVGRGFDIVLEGQQLDEELNSSNSNSSKYTKQLGGNH